MINLYHLLRATFWLLHAFSRASWHMRGQAARSIALPAGLVMTAKENRRFKHYFYGTTFLATVMCSLRNLSQSRLEKHLFTNLSALAFCFDDLVEAFRDEGDPGILWQDNPEAYGQATDKRGLGLHLLHNIYQTLPEEGLLKFKAYMHRVFNVETATNQRQPEAVGLEDLKKLTAEKGGCSVLLFRSLLYHPLSEAEENALYQFGYLIQCCDDIFDLWHDRQADINTPATYCAEQGEVELMSKNFEQQVAITYQAFRQTHYPVVQVETAVHIIHYLISITRVCLHHYIDIKLKHGKMPLENRTAIVVDMEKWSNRYLAARNLLRPL